MELLDTNITIHSTPNNPKNKNLPKNPNLENANIQNLIEVLSKFADKDGNIYTYQAGSGTLKIDHNGKIILGKPGNTAPGEYIEEKYMRGGGLSVFKADKGSIIYKRGLGRGLTRGIRINQRKNAGFDNKPTAGDSGSSFYVYDSVNEKWVLLGVASTSDYVNTNQIGFVSKADFEDFKKNAIFEMILSNGKLSGTRTVGALEQYIDLANSTWTMDSLSLIHI